MLVNGEFVVSIRVYVVVCIYRMTISERNRSVCLLHKASPDSWSGIHELRQRRQRIVVVLIGILRA
jgi:hypothetical protein